MSVRVGIGYDIHKFVAGRKLFLGGVEIAFPRGLAGHSDADVLVHAICDAILGALGKGDIGEHFPITDDRFKNISSLKLLVEVNDLVVAGGYRIENIDSVVIAEEPNLKNYKTKMREAMANVLQISPSDINIKATTAEGLGSIGRKEGIAAYATVALTKK